MRCYEDDHLEGAKRWDNDNGAVAATKDEVADEELLFRVAAHEDIDAMRSRTKADASLSQHKDDSQAEKVSAGCLVAAGGNAMLWEEKLKELKRYKVIHEEHFEEDPDGDIVEFKDVVEFLMNLTQEDF